MSYSITKLYASIAFITNDFTLLSAIYQHFQMIVWVMIINNFKLWSWWFRFCKISIVSYEIDDKLYVWLLSSYIMYWYISYFLYYYVRYICDPVLGDNGKYYVPPAMINIFIEKLIPRFVSLLVLILSFVTWPVYLFIYRIYLSFCFIYLPNISIYLFHIYYIYV